MVEVELAEGEPEHADWRVDDAFPRKAVTRRKRSPVGLTT
jgi:hypothetical protein